MKKYLLFKLVALVLLVGVQACDQQKFEGRGLDGWIYDLKSEKAFVVVKACKVLGDAGEPALVAVEQLVGLLDGRNVKVVTAASDALGKLGAKATASVKPLLQSDEPDVRLVAAQTIFKTGAEDQETIQVVMNALTSIGNRELSGKARMVVADRPKVFAEALLKAVDTPDAEIQRIIVAAMAGLGKDANKTTREKIVGIFTNKENDKAVRQEAMQGVLRMLPETEWATLFETMRKDEEDPLVNYIAVTLNQHKANLEAVAEKAQKEAEAKAAAEAAAADTSVKE